MDSAPLKRSPINDFHIEMNAKMADFGGWEMPIEYPADLGGGVLNEHNSVRERVGLFDVSHLGKASVTGGGALEFLNQAFTNDLTKIADGKAQYTMLCDEKTGGVVDDLIVYRKSPTDFLLVPNAANTGEVLNRLSKKAPKEIRIANNHMDYGVFALQGQLAKDVLRFLGCAVELPYMAFTNALIAGREVTICRTGYTGEFGFEILPNWNEANEVWQVLLEEVRKRGGLPAGLGARDTLRTEMGYPLHGHELSLEITPLQAGANWAVGWSKSNFWGKEALLDEKAKGPKRLMRGLLLQERGIPRAGMKVFVNQSEIGETTSGTFSPTIKAGIALALLDASLEIGAEVFIDIRGKNVRAKVAKLPFVPSRVR
ncbi:MAG: glycine cleavage system aminomethyltransferase GcvT [Actinobacteria bacterium]|nr:glycine cleavage system aminomethyltransferase GcvT [Actinomycetota bacterium]